LRAVTNCIAIQQARGLTNPSVEIGIEDRRPETRERVREAFEKMTITKD
jgi:hypothetical protein